jgi:chromosomal replication initiator protein
VEALGEAIAHRIGEPRYKLWFAGKTKFTWRENQLVVGVANRFAQEWLQKKFVDDLANAASEVLGDGCEISFAIDSELFQAARRDQARSAAESKEPKGVDQPVEAPTSKQSPRLGSSAGLRAERRWRQLSEFVVGKCNRVAHASALAVVEAPQVGANPLIFHGPVGTGKTHLLEGIYLGFRQQYPDWHVCYTTAEEFTNRFLQSMRTNKVSAFRNYFRDCDALLVDNLQFLAKKRATQEEFLHTFDVLLAHGKPLVFNSDCHPRMADEFSPELTDRFLGGAVWGLEPPDMDTRLGVLRMRNLREGQRVPDEVLVQLAELLHGNVRELEGTLHTVVHVSRVSNRVPDLQLVREVLSDRLRHFARATRMEDVDRAVCRALGLENGWLQSRQRNWRISHPRMLAMFLCRKHTSAAYSAIGNYFGGLNHSTVVAAEKRMRRLLQDNGVFAAGEKGTPLAEIVQLVERQLAR